MFDSKSFLILALFFMLSGIGLTSQSYASELERLSIPVKSPSFYEDWQEPKSLYGKPLEVAKAKLVKGIYEGQPVIALRLIMSAGWHSYWYFPGAAGIAPTFEWGASPYFSAGEPLFLPPKRFKEPGGLTYGYDDETKRKVEKDIFTTQEEAEDRSEAIGCFGFHSHDGEDGKIFMPCASHADYERLTGDKLPRKYHTADPEFQVTDDDDDKASTRATRDRVAQRDTFGRP